jgi:hypothetical protein
VSGLLWLLSAGLAVWRGPRAAVITLVAGGFFIFPVTELLRRVVGGKTSLSADNSLRDLGMQVAFVLPLSMPLLLPVSLYRLTWFYPGLMVLLGAHYLPFVFLYGMRILGVLGAALIGAGGFHRDVLVQHVQRRRVVHRGDASRVCMGRTVSRAARAPGRGRPTTGCSGRRCAPPLNRSVGPTTCIDSCLSYTGL